MGALRRVIDRSVDRRAEADKCENLERWTASCRCDPSGEWETIFYRLRFESDDCGRVTRAFIIVRVVCILFTVGIRIGTWPPIYVYYIVITDDINGSQRTEAVYILRTWRGYFRAVEEHRCDYRAVAVAGRSLRVLHRKNRRRSVVTSSTIAACVGIDV